MTRTLPVTCVVVILALLGEVRSEKSPSKVVWKDCTDDACQVCYDDIGCFEARTQCGEDPKDAKDQLPETPADVETVFLLYDKQNQDEATMMHRGDSKQWFLDQKFDPNKDTKIIVHGIKGPNYYGLLEHLKEQFFVKGLNIFMINWQTNVDSASVNEQGIRDTYRKVAQNARIAGRELGMFLKYVHDTLGVSYDSMHIIGHDVGCHASGYAGKYIRDHSNGEKIARITALAPSSPYYELESGVLKPKECRLSSDDAKFVDAIHADRPSEAKITLGIESEIGHVDFYPNDGKDRQPGCKYMFCSHGRPLEYYEQSMKAKATCTFQSEPCTWKGSSSCPADGCPVMGYDVNVNARGVFCVTTTEYEPFCKKVPNSGAKKPSTDQNVAGQPPLVKPSKGGNIKN